MKVCAITSIKFCLLVQFVHAERTVDKFKRARDPYAMCKELPFIHSRLKYRSVLQYTSTVEIYYMLFEETLYSTTLVFYETDIHISNQNQESQSY